MMMTNLTISMTAKIVMILAERENVKAVMQGDGDPFPANRFLIQRLNAVRTEVMTCIELP